MQTVPHTGRRTLLERAAGGVAAIDRLLEQLATFNLAVGAEHESAKRGRDDDARVVLVAGRNGACDAPETRVAGVAVQVDAICKVCAMA